VSQQKNAFQEESFHPPFFLFLDWWLSWLEVGITGHNFGSFHKSLIAIGPVVSEEKIFM
jgi:hypothetical protein